MSDKEEQVNRLRNRHVAKLLTNLSEINCLPSVVENEIKREFSYFAADILEQVIGNHKSGVEENEKIHRNNQMG